jgi:deazaflavin-dependent oxidoreductase (nitroreductase family)
MPLTGEYAPSTAGWARKQVERYEATNGKEANDLRGRPIIVLTSLGAKTGKLRKTPLMRVEHEGLYAVVASQGGAPKHPVLYFNLKANPHVELQDGAAKRDYLARELRGAHVERLQFLGELLARVNRKPCHLSLPSDSPRSRR